MASTAGYNDKNAQVYSPVSAHRGAPSAPAYYDLDTPDMTAAGNGNTSSIPYAVQVDAGHPPPPSAAYPPFMEPTCMAVPPQVQSNGTSEWKISFCGCLATPAHCCMAFFFPCVNAAYTAHGIDRPAALVGIVFFIAYTGCAIFPSGPSYDGDAWFSYYNSYDENTTTYSMWNAGAAICALAFIIATTMLRRAVRHFDRIPGSTISDACASFWCSCCVLAQLSAHTERVNPLRSANAATLPAYHAT